MSDSSRISPTAHYTGFVWHRHGLSHPALVTRRGRLFFWAMQPVNWIAVPFTGGVTLETFLLQRHRIIDHLLTRQILAGRISQVVEIAAGLSPRGLTFSAAHPQLRYIEADLPGMVRTKRELLDRHGLWGPDHSVVEIDALSDDGLATLLAERTDPDRGTAIITEGLLNYFSREQVTGLWGRIAVGLAGYPADLYLSDLHLAADASAIPLGRAFRRFLGAFARGTVHLHFDDEADALRALESAGFSEPKLRQAQEFRDALELPECDAHTVVRVVEASGVSQE